jgi:hypothetical protein
MIPKLFILFNLMNGWQAVAGSGGEDRDDQAARLRPGVLPLPGQHSRHQRHGTELRSHRTLVLFIFVFSLIYQYFHNWCSICDMQLLFVFYNKN